MANIFKSKEVYKHVIKPGNTHQLIPVRGVYVANQQRSPYYIDHTISIVGIGTTPAEVITYTERSVDVYEFEIPNTSLSITNDTISVVSYTRRSLTVYEPYEIENTSLVITNDTINIYDYTRASVSVYDDYDIKGCSFVCTNDTLVVESISTDYKSEIDGFLQITNFTSNEATIT